MNKLYVLTFAFLCAANLSTVQAQTETAPAGSGTASDPHIISSLNNLAWLQDPNNDSAWVDYYKQTADIDASSDSSWNSGAGFTPIGNSGMNFSGTYDGGGYTITGLFISQSTGISAGMFGYTLDARLKNMKLSGERFSVTGAGSNVGGLIGWSMVSTNTSTTIDSCSTSGVIYCAGNDAGGLVGFNGNQFGNSTPDNEIIYSSSSCSVSGGNSTEIGGLIGENFAGILTACYFAGIINDSSNLVYAGGLIGRNRESSTISGCYNTGNISSTGTNTSVGGLIGYSESGAGTMTNCYNNGRVSGSGISGGLVGTNVATVSNCYNTGTVSGGTDVGGLVGENQDVVKYSYSTGSVTGSSAYGGLIGYDLDINLVGSSFWDTGTSGQASSSGGTPEPDSAMKAEATFTGHGWDFTNTWGIYSAINGGYPYLQNVTQFSAPSPSAPMAVTSPASSIAGTSAIVNGAVSSDGDTTIVYFLYGTSSGNYPDSVTASQNPLIPWDSIQVSDTLKGLTGSTTYYVRVSAKNSVGYARGSEISFTTLAPPTPPTAVTDSVSSISGTTATAYGASNPDGASDTVRFLYGTVSGTYTDSVTAAQSPATGYSPVNVSASLSGLTPSQTYYIRVSASNGLGYVRGGEKSFTTTPLVVETAPSGSGTSGDPHIIASLDNLAWLQDAANDSAWGDYYKQTANINAALTSTLNSAAGLSPIGNSSVNFVGTYDGQGYVIDSLYMSRTSNGNDYQGLFGIVGSSAVIDSLGVTNANVSGYDFVGALAGYSSSNSSVSHCYSTGKVYASYGDCGGLVGESYGAVAESFSNCSISGGSNYSMGGLVGYCPYGSGAILNCYTTGEVNVGCPGAGGLVGNNSGAAVDDCYSVSKVAETIVSPSNYGGLIGGNFGGSVSASFYNSDSTSGGTTAGTSESSSNMKTESTYTNSSWDFTSTWAINGSINSGYPYLQGAHDFSLAVQATGFTATADVGSVTLTWKTESEVNNAGFIVLRRQSGIGNWQSAGSYIGDDSLRGLGTSSTGKTYDFTDDKVISGDTYMYKIQSVSTNGTTKDLSTLTVTVDVPKTYALYQNYPNPFNPSTTVRFDLKEQSNVILDIYNVLGQRVIEENYGNMNAGRYDENISMSRFASGVYFFRINAEGAKGDKFVAIKKLMLLK